MPKINAEKEAKRQRRKEIAGILDGLGVPYTSSKSKLSTCFYLYDVCKCDSLQKKGSLSYLPPVSDYLNTELL